MSNRTAPGDLSGRIPIAAAKRIAQEYGYQQVVIFARDHLHGKEHVTTFGVSVADCEVAAQMGNNLKRHVGWPEHLCHDKPARLKRKDKP